MHDVQQQAESTASNLTRHLRFQLTMYHANTPLSRQLVPSPPEPLFAKAVHNQRQQSKAYSAYDVPCLYTA